MTVWKVQLSDSVIHFLAKLFQPPRPLSVPTQLHNLQPLTGAVTLFKDTTSSGSPIKITNTQLLFWVHTLPTRQSCFLDIINAGDTKFSNVCLYSSHHRKIGCFSLPLPSKFSRIFFFFLHKTSNFREQMVTSKKNHSLILLSLCHTKVLIQPSTAHSAKI